MFVNLENAFDRVSRKVLEWAMRKKEIPEVLVRLVMSLYGGAKPRVRLYSVLSDEFEIKAPRICAVTFSFCSGLRCCH